LRTRQYLRDLSVLEVCSREGAKQIHVYLYLYVTQQATDSVTRYTRVSVTKQCNLILTKYNKSPAWCN